MNGTDGSSGGFPRAAGALVMSCVALLLATSFVAEGPHPAPRSAGDPGGAPVGLTSDGQDGRSLRPAEPEAAATDPGTISILTGEDGLDADLVAAVLAIEGVGAASRVRSGATGLLGSAAADGSAHDVPPAGMRIPAIVTAIEPAAYREVLGAGIGAIDAELVAALNVGEVLLPRSSARLRGLGPGAEIDLGASSGLVVLGIVDDAVSRGSEFVVHIDEADRIGLGPRESLLVRLAAVSAPTLEEVVARVDGGGDEGIRIRHGGARVQLVLSAIEVKERFGEFAFRLDPRGRDVEIEQGFIDRWITMERMPVIGNVRCHRLIMNDLRAAIEESVEAGYADWLSPRAYGGCFHARRIGTSRENLSRHSWGIAIDLNVDFSQPGAGAVPPDGFIAIWGRHGFRWGGDFSTPDNHHFEWVGEAASLRPDRGRDSDA